MNSVLDARVLELDDELKEAYNKFDNLKSELVIFRISFRIDVYLLMVISRYMPICLA